MGILRLVGEKIEKPEIVLKLLDTNYFKERPGYPLASPNNLVLYDCKYKDVNFHIPEGSNQIFLEKMMFNLYREQILKLKLISSIALNFKKSILNNENHKIVKTFKAKRKKRTTIEKAYKNHIFGKKNKMIKPQEMSKLSKIKSKKTKKIKKKPIEVSKNIKK
jgi:hypothetical protein